MAIIAARIDRPPLPHIHFTFYLLVIFWRISFSSHFSFFLIFFLHMQHMFPACSWPAAHPEAPYSRRHAQFQRLCSTFLDLIPHIIHIDLWFSARKNECRQESFDVHIVYFFLFRSYYSFNKWKIEMGRTSSLLNINKQTKNKKINLINYYINNNAIITLYCYKYKLHVISEAETEPAGPAGSCSAASTPSGS